MTTQVQKPIWWKVILGAILLTSNINNRINPAPNLLKADNAAQQFGMNLVSFAFLGLALWLLYSGSKPLWRKNP
jgi:hypothetical protein